MLRTTREEMVKAHLRLVVTGQQTGRQSLITMALLKTGVSPEDPQLKPIVAAQAAERQPAAAIRSAPADDPYGF